MTVKHHAKLPTETNKQLKPPSSWLMAMELRAFWELGAVLPAWPLLRQAPRGDGHSVIVFPGLSASDTSTLPMRSFLAGAVPG